MNITENKSETQAIMEKALADHVGADISELEPTRFDHYGMSSYEMGHEEWAIGSDDDANDAVREYIEQSAWAFRASFILGCCGLPYELEEAIESWQGKECESCNDAIVKMIENTCGMDHFVEEAIRCDGRGHFLSSYDGEEVELKTEAGTFFAYRIN